jgi:CotS family spore coat protein
MEQIRQGGYHGVDMILPNKEGSLISKDWEENKYVVKEWYVGRECDTSSENEILAAVGNLARLHRLMHLDPESEFRKNFSAVPPLQEVHSQNAELRKIRSYVRRKNDKCPFERLFLTCFDRYYEQAASAEEKLEHLQLHKQDGICHGDYNHHHVLMCGYEIATTNFECCRFDYQVNDLYRFMRKILEKHDWNQRLGLRMLEHYALERPLSREERSLLSVRMRYPEKFRKLANYYYGSSKAWIPARFREKLEVLNRQEEKRHNFVRMLEK